MSDVKVTAREMRTAFKRNLDASRGLQGHHTSSESLLLFYAAECGLKFCLMQKNRHRDSDGVAGFGHKISRLIREVGLTPSELGGHQILETMALINHPKISIANAHAAWRYAALWEADDEVQVREFLQATISAVQARISNL